MTEEKIAAALARKETPVEAHARGAHPKNDRLLCPACERARMAELGS